MFRTPLTLFRTLAIAEVFSWTLLIAGLILRATTDWALGVSIGGGIHGFVFLSYGATVILVSRNNRWKPGPTIAALASAVIPYATIPAEIWLHRRGLLAGQWRLQPTDDPRDNTWHDRLFRTMLRRPWILAGLIVLIVALIFVVLLTLGPPGGRK